MKNLLLLVFFIPFFSLGQFQYSSKFPVNFKIDNVTLGIDEDIVNVSGGSLDGIWAVKMTWTFTNLFETKDSDEYTAFGWTQDGENFLETTARGVWKKNGKVFDVNHFENGLDGNQLLTTGVFDFVNDTYKCIVRVIQD